MPRVLGTYSCTGGGVNVIKLRNTTFIRQPRVKTTWLEQILPVETGNNNNNKAKNSTQKIVYRFKPISFLLQPRGFNPWLGRNFPPFTPFLFDDHRTDLTAPTPEMLNRQAEFLDGVSRVCREYREIIVGVTLWGVADDQTWLDGFPVKRKNWPLLFGTQHQPKKAFWEIVEF